MKKNVLFVLWGSLFSLCAGLGFIPEPAGTVRALLTALALSCFLPPALMLSRAARQRDTAILKLIRNLSALSLGLTLVLLILNFFTAFAPEALGMVLYYILVIVSSPMICSGHWALSLFLWACLLMASLRQLRK